MAAADTGLVGDHAEPEPCGPNRIDRRPRTRHRYDARRITVVGHVLDQRVVTVEEDRSQRGH